MTDKTNDDAYEHDLSDEIPDDTSPKDDYGVDSALAALDDLASDDDMAPSDDEHADDIQAVTPTEDAIDEIAYLSEDEQASLDIYTDSDDNLEPSDPDSEHVAYEATYARPAGSKLYRGQAASVVPALLLIGIGIAFTLALSREDFMLNTPTLVALTVSAGGVALWAQWLSSQRRARGSFFVGALLILLGATGAFLAQPTTPGLVDGSPLLIIATGAALLLSAAVGRDVGRSALVGLILLLIGGVTLLLTLDMIDENLLAALRTGWFVAPIVLLLVIIAPVFRR